MFGHGAVEAGAEGEVEVRTPAGVEEARAGELACSHRVQIVDVEVIKIVDVETPTEVVVKPLEV